MDPNACLNACEEPYKMNRVVPLWAVLILCCAACVGGLVCAGQPARAASRGWKVYLRTIHADEDHPDDVNAWNWRETDHDAGGGEPFAIFPADHGSTYVFYKVAQ
jgi:hypothetical protein